MIRDVVQRLPVELDQVDRHERPPRLVLDRIGQLLGEPLLGDRLGQVLRGTARRRRTACSVQIPSISASSASIDGSSTSAASAATSSVAASPRSSVTVTRPSRRRAMTRSPRHAGSNIHSMLWTTASDGVASWGRILLVGARHRASRYRRPRASVHPPLSRRGCSWPSSTSAPTSARICSQASRSHSPTKVMAVPSLPARAGPSDAVDVGVRVLRDVVAEDVGQVGDVQAAAGDVGGHQELDLAGLEVGQGPGRGRAGSCRRAGQRRSCRAASG